MAPTVIPAKAGIQFFRSPAWMPAGVYPERRRRAGMTNWVALVAAYLAHIHFAHISPNLASPEACPEHRRRGEGFQPSPKGTLTAASPLPCLRRGRPLDEVGEERGHLVGFLVPFFPRAQGLVVVLGEENVHLALLEQAT